MVCGYIVEEVGGSLERGLRDCGECVDRVWGKCLESSRDIVEGIWRHSGESVETVWRDCGKSLEIMCVECVKNVETVCRECGENVWSLWGG